ncbi:hypothetical protein ABGB16_29140 [Micromonospora sp. B11E3]|uniref:hypothetical protein n=1 Tax=Micromonospora sp. B11E3 TaxID=3153562 RepID=UPI00325EDD10
MTARRCARQALEQLGHGPHRSHRGRAVSRSGRPASWVGLRTAPATGRLRWPHGPTWRHSVSTPNRTPRCLATSRSR